MSDDTQQDIPGEDEAVELSDIYRTFTDTKGRVYQPRFSCASIIDLEQMREIGFFELGLDLATELQSLGDAPDQARVISVLMDYAKALFGGVGVLTKVLYDACANSKGKVFVPVEEHGIETPVEVDFRDFCQSIDKANAGDAMLTAIAGIIEYFPVSETQVGGEGSDPMAKIAATIGSMFSSSPPSRG